MPRSNSIPASNMDSRLLNAKPTTKARPNDTGNGFSASLPARCERACIGPIKAHTDTAILGGLTKHEMGNEKDIPDALPSIHGLTPRMRGRNRVRSVPQFVGMAKKLQKKSSRISLSSNLRAVRSLFRWSQEELGLQCGLKRTYIGALERREVNPGIDNLDKLALGVGVLAHVLLLSPELAYAEIYGAFSLGSAH